MAPTVSREWNINKYHGRPKTSDENVELIRQTEYIRVRSPSKSIAKRVLQLVFYARGYVCIPIKSK